MKGSCLIKENDKICLSKVHSYYYQVILQMYALQLTFCDFVWCIQFLFVERIIFDEVFCTEKLEFAMYFHRQVIIPELLSRWYTMQKNGVSHNVALWCDCNQPVNGQEMIQCANANCDIVWFHLNCTTLPNVTTLYWFCKTCSKKLFS